jgi:quercetin dioxygenase-like cupin family protein
MPIQVVRFGVGHRRPEGPPGTRGIKGQVIHSDARGVVSELAFGRGALIEPHTNPNTTWFIVIEGGGWVAVDGERLRVAAGEAVLWPAHVPHGAWTELGHMRAIVVELSGADDSLARGILPGEALSLEPGEGGVPAAGEGRLAERAAPPERVDRSTGEPL